jgi:hypothetical protein
MLSDNDKKYLLSLKPSDITADLIYEHFSSRAKVVDGKFVRSNPRFRTNDTFYLEPKEYFNTTKVLTNVGLFLYNKVIIEGRFEHILGYHNTTITNNVHSDIEDKLITALRYDKITPGQFADYLNRIQWLGMTFNSVFAPSFTMDTIKPNKKVISERDKIIKANKDKIDNGDIKIAVDMEKKLTSMAYEELKNDPGRELYDSGARGSFDNAYKNMNIMKGPIYSQGRWHVISNNLTDGIEKDDIEAYSNAYISSQYPKSVGTQVAGYLVKRVSAGFQAIVADKKGSDCGATQTIIVRITKANYKQYADRYIVEGSKFKLLTLDNIESYIGKTVKMRTPMYCLGGNRKCNICLGDIYYNLEMENVGLSVSKMASTILNLNMKKFHNASAKLHDIDLDNISIEIKI